MEAAVQGLCGVLVSEKVLETQAVRVYAIACRYKMVEEARMAAITTLRGPIEEIYVDEFETLPTIHYFKSLKYRRTRLEGGDSGERHRAISYDGDPVRLFIQQAGLSPHGVTHTNISRAGEVTALRLLAGVADVGETMSRLADRDADCPRTPLIFGTNANMGGRFSRIMTGSFG